nr:MULTISPECIES: hypothetical protein [unclassified Mesotoga]
MKKVSVVLVVVMLSVASLALVNEGYESPVINVVEAAGPAVVKVDVEATRKYSIRDPYGFEEFFRRFFGEIPDQKVTGVGSGFIFSKDGYISLTNMLSLEQTRYRYLFSTATSIRQSILEETPN